MRWFVVAGKKRQVLLMPGAVESIQEVGSEDAERPRARCRITMMSGADHYVMADVQEVAQWLSQ